jgi:hypothetical protein
MNQIRSIATVKYGRVATTPFCSSVDSVGEWQPILYIKAGTQA